MTDAPRTLPEMLDAAPTGVEFGNVLMGMFSALEKLRDEEEDEEEEAQ